MTHIQSLIDGVTAKTTPNNDCGQSLSALNNNDKVTFFYTGHPTLQYIVNMLNNFFLYLLKKLNNEVLV
jgi:hypothetical protein